MNIFSIFQTSCYLLFWQLKYKVYLETQRSTWIAYIYALEKFMLKGQNSMAARHKVMVIYTSVNMFNS